MRTILFRGKTTDGEWIYGTPVLRSNDNYLSTSIAGIIRVSDDGQLMFSNVIASSIGQFTGLSDKNGNKIYEGDIIKMAYDWDYENGHELQNRIFKKSTKKYKGYSIRKVEWEGGEFAHFVTNPKRCNLSSTSTLIEIIGNIFDDVELLNLTVL